MSRHPIYTEESLREFQRRMTRPVRAEGRSVNEQALGPYGTLAAPSPNKFGGYRSKLELSWSKYLDGLKTLGAIKQYWYEPFSIWLPGKIRFKPDFLVWANDGMTVYEVKGYSPNRRDGMTRLKVASGIFPCFVWVLVTRSKGAWDETRIG